MELPFRDEKRMKIGIDITQSIFEGTGVAEYVKSLVASLLKYDQKNEYVLFLSHPTYDASKLVDQVIGKSTNVTLKRYRLPISFLEFVWNRLHIVPIEWLIGEVDVFFTSDWVEPPAKKAIKVTTIHDLSVLKVPETFDKHIVAVHKRKLNWVVQESEMVLCDSIATQNDVHTLLGIDKKKLTVVYPGLHS